MRRELGLIGGASAVAIAAVIVTQSGLVSGPSDADPPGDADSGTVAAPASAADDAVAEPGTETVAEEHAPMPGETDPVPALEAELDRMREALAAREAELEELASASAEHEAELADLNETLAERDAELGARTLEIAGLREKIRGLERLLAFDLKLAEMKEGDVSLPADADADAAVLVDTALDAPDGEASELAEFAAAPEQELTEVHFEMGSASLTPGGQSRAAVAAVMLADMDLSVVRLIGYTDRVGSPERNRELAAARAKAVAQFLVSAGLSDTLIETDAMGEADLPVSTGDGVSEPLNRCVAIVAVMRQAT